MSNESDIDLDKALATTPETTPNGRPLAKWERAIEASRKRFEQIADKSLVTYDRESLFAMQHLIKSDYAMKIAEQNPKSVILAMANVAATGLSLNPAYGLAYLVPRDGAIRLDISYKGLLQIATDTGSIKWGRADVVYKADSFVYNGPADAPEHRADVFAKDRGEIIGAYCIAKTCDGDILAGVMTLAELHTVRGASESWKRGAVGKKGPWENYFEEMAKKAIIKRDQKTWPKTDQHKRLNDAIQIANEAEGGYTFDHAGPARVIESPPVKILPTDGAWDHIGDEAREYLEQRAAIVKDLYEAQGVEAANTYLDGLQLDAEETIAIWTLLPSPLRTASKRARA
jgi:phage RecT family recombinase